MACDATIFHPILQFNNSVRTHAGFDANHNMQFL
jgi:hypothetical protein